MIAIDRRVLAPEAATRKYQTTVKEEVQGENDKLYEQIFHVPAPRLESCLSDDAIYSTANLYASLANGGSAWWDEDYPYSAQAGCAVAEAIFSEPLPDQYWVLRKLSVSFSDQDCYLGLFKKKNWSSPMVYILVVPPETNIPDFLNDALVGLFQFECRG